MEKISTDYKNHEEIKILCEYLQIPSVHPNVDYEPCISFIKKLADELELPYQVYRFKDPKKPFIVLTWKGTQSELPSILLNSHMDVVPVFEEHWKYPPFSAHIDEDGKIYARGSQDMKCVGMWYLAAIRALKKKGFIPKRTVHISFVPDEEIGGADGMETFIETDEFKSLNIGFGLDEAAASMDEIFHVFYAERSQWNLTFKINGPPGHGSLIIPNTAGEKASYLISKFMEFRKCQFENIEGRFMDVLKIGDCTTVNLTKMSGGVQTNVIPPQFCITFDMRIAVDVDHDEFESQIRQWCEEAGGNIEMVFESKQAPAPPTKVDDSNEYFTAFKSALDDLELKYQTCICPAGTDARFLRSIGIPALGFTAIKNTPVLLHDHDEFIYAETYLEGIEIYAKIIENLTSLVKSGK